MIEAAGVIAGPVLAIVIAHIFSFGLVQRVELARRLTMREWFSTARSESRFLLLAVPPLAMLFILDLAGVPLVDTIRVIIWLEAFSLTFWVVLSAYRAGLRGRSLVLAGLAGLAMTATVIGLQVVLQPGEAVQDGVAVGYP